MSPDRQTDILVIGSGIAGISYALRCAEYAKVTVITKSHLEESNTRFAQGGIAAVFSASDSTESHISDTIKAGAGLNDPDIVRMVVEQAPGAVMELYRLGVPFDQKENGAFELHLEGGHSHHRIVHTHDETGKAVETALVRKLKTHPNISVMESCFARDLWIENHRCWGAILFDAHEQSLFRIRASVTMLANGGCGQIYQINTNSVVATGDGLAMAARAGAALKDLEFVQFHPTVLFTPKTENLLITEALRGAGAVLKKQNGSLLDIPHPQGSLAPRDIVTRAIFSEISKGESPCVFLDATRIPQDILTRDFPHIKDICLQNGIDILKEMIPVLPAAHYMCGGILVNSESRTSIDGLYAAGEVTCTGLHGANRLASNSLLEAVVFAKSAAISTVNHLHSAGNPFIANDEIHITICQNPDLFFIDNTRRKIKKIMWEHCGIIRSYNGLTDGLHALEKIISEINYRELQEGFSVLLAETGNMAQVAVLILRSALERRDSAGCHYRIN